MYPNCAQDERNGFSQQFSHPLSLPIPSWVTQKKSFNLHSCLHKPEIPYVITSKTPSCFKAALLFYVPLRKKIVLPIKQDTHTPLIVRDILT